MKKAYPHNNINCAEYNLVIPSVAYERPVVRYGIPGEHDAGGEPVARVAHHPSDGPRDLSLSEKPEDIQVPSETDAARRRCSRDSVRSRRMHRNAFGSERAMIIGYL